MVGEKKKKLVKLIVDVWRRKAVRVCLLALVSFLDRHNTSLSKKMQSVYAYTNAKFNLTIDFMIFLFLFYSFAIPSHLGCLCKKQKQKIFYAISGRFSINVHI